MNLFWENIEKAKESGLPPELMFKEVIKGHIETLMGELNLIMGAANWIARWFSEEGPMTMQEIGQFYADYLVEPLLRR